MSGPCERVARRLPALLDDPDGLTGEDAEHVGHCLQCQAAVAQHRRIRRTLHGLEPGRAGDPSRVDAVLRAVHRQDARRRRTVRRRVAVGLAAVTAMGLGAAAVAARRRSA